MILPGFFRIWWGRWHHSDVTGPHHISNIIRRERRLPRHVEDLVDQRPVMFNHCLPAGLHARRDQTVLLSELVGNDFELAD